MAVSEEYLSALALLAEERETFASHGLDVTVTRYSSSQLALEALRDGQVDVATCADTPIVLAALEGDSPRIIATIGSSANDIKVVARADQGIVSPEDLRGARIGTRRRTAADFFLHTFLGKHGMLEQDVEVVHGSFDESADALVEGTLAAATLRPPQLGDVQQRLGDGAVTFEEPGLYVKTMNLVISDSVSIDTCIGLLASLIAVEPEAGSHLCEDAADELAAILDTDAESVCDSLRSNEYKVRLDQSLLLTLEDAARWGAGPNTDLPDFLSQLCLDPLDEIGPGRVSVIR
jgi:NitT/TauT family transport system substrate-binding protein